MQLRVDDMQHLLFGQADWGRLYARRFRPRYERTSHRIEVQREMTFGKPSLLSNQSIAHILLLFVFNPMTMIFATPAFIASVVVVLFFVLFVNLCCDLAKTPWPVGGQMLNSSCGLASCMLSTTLRIVLTVRLVTIPLNQYDFVYGDLLDYVTSQLKGA